MPGTPGPWKLDSNQAYYLATIIQELPYKNHKLIDIFQGFRSIPVAIEDLSLTSRSRNSLLRNGITSLDQIGKLNVEDLVDFRQLGESSVNEILHTYISNLSSDRDSLGEGDDRFVNKAGFHHINKRGVRELTATQLGKVMQDLLAVISYKELQIISSEISKETNTRQARNMPSHVLKRGLNGIESFRLLGLLTNVGPGISSISEMLEEHPYLRCSISENALSATLLEILIFAGWVDIAHGYINISAGLRESFSREYLDILDAEISIEKARLRLKSMAEYLTTKASEFALDSVRARSRKLDSENSNIRTNDLQGDDYWLKTFTSKSGSGRDEN